MLLLICVRHEWATELYRHQNYLHFCWRSGRVHVNYLFGPITTGYRGMHAPHADQCHVTWLKGLAVSRPCLKVTNPVKKKTHTPKKFFFIYICTTFPSMNINQQTSSYFSLLWPVQILFFFCSLYSGDYWRAVFKICCHWGWWES